jgi:penicillin amidase
MAASVTIHRDTYGVPHIYGPTDASVVFGLMYAQAEDNFWQIEETYIGALARRSEVYGSASIGYDAVVRAFEPERRAREEYNNASPEIQAICDAFAAGLNYYLQRNPQVRPRLIRRFEPWHILASHYSVAPGRVPFNSLNITLTTLGTEPATLRLVEDLPTPREGSNMWVIGPSKSASGSPMLFINPHVSFFGNGQRYEAHLESGEGLHISGFAALGTPYIRAGHNRDLGWSHTDSGGDVADIYVETFDDRSNPLAYRYGTNYRTATEWTEEIPVMNGARLVISRVRLRKTHHGPVFRAADGRWLSIRAADLERPGLLEQRLAMAKARSLEEFRAALSQAKIVGSNIIYADRAGNVFYLHGNAIPKRSTSFDWTVTVDGSDPETEWHGFHDIADLPQLLNPPSGFIQNCNSTPFLASAEGNPDRGNYPGYMGTEGDNLRAEQSRRILLARDKFDFDDWSRVALDTHVLRAGRVLPALFDLYQQLEGARAERLTEAMAELRKWDHVSRTDSVAMTLYDRWDLRVAELNRQSQDRFAPIAALEDAIVRLESSFGTWRVAWGEVNRLQRVHTSGTLEPFSDTLPSVPSPGARPAHGIIFAFNVTTPAGQSRSYGTAGDSYIGVVEFSEVPRGRSLLVFGQSADPLSPHYFDQAPLYSEARFKPAWFERSEVEANTERSYHPGQ